jgi:uncharacterized protein (TIGR03435 family)
MSTERVLSAIGIAAAVYAPLLLAQSSDAQRRPTFEIISIKPVVASGEAFNTGGVLPGGRFEAVTSVRGLISYAFGSGTSLRTDQVIGLDARIAAMRFSVRATAGDDVPPNFAEVVFPMLQALLEDRFTLRTHSESRMLPAYALTTRDAGRLGPAIRRSTADCEARNEHPTPDAPACGFRYQPGRLTAIGLPMSDIAAVIQSTASRIRSGLPHPVFDRTGLAGNFDFEMEWDPLVENAIMTLVQEQLGLKLELRQEPVDVIVIDHIEPPTPD